MSRPVARLFALLAVALLVLGACGNDDDDTAAPTTTTSAPTTDDAGDDDDTTTTTDDGDDTTTTTAGGSRPQGDFPNVAAIGDFCELFRTVDEIDDPFDLSEDEMMADPDLVGQTFAFAESIFVRAVELAPGEIREDMAMLASGMREMNALLAEYDYDFMAMAMASAQDPEAMERLETFDSPEFLEASDRIDAYVEDECGVSMD